MNTSIEELNLTSCGIDLEGPTGWQDILADISKNCSLRVLKLDGNIINSTFLETLALELERNI